MTHGKLAEIVVQFIEFLELIDDEHLDSRAAVKQQESIAAELEEATSEERAAVMHAARSKLASMLREPDEFVYSPRKTLSSEHRALLEESRQVNGLGGRPAALHSPQDDQATALDYSVGGDRVVLADLGQPWGGIVAGTIALVVFGSLGVLILRGIGWFGAASIRSQSRMFEGVTVYDGPSLGKVGVVFHTYSGLLVFVQQVEYKFWATPEDARKVLSR